MQSTTGKMALRSAPSSVFLYPLSPLPEPCPRIADSPAGVMKTVSMRTASYKRLLLKPASAPARNDRRLTQLFDDMRDAESHLFQALRRSPLCI